MSFMKEHPIVTLLIGVGIGIAFGSQIKSLPLIGRAASAIPSGR